MSILAAFVVPHPPLILPEIGKGEEQKIQLTVNAYARAMSAAADLQPDTVIISSPHTVMYADYFHIAPGDAAVGDFAQFGAPDVIVSAAYDAEFAKALEREALAEGIAAGPHGGRGAALDHGVMVPLRFLQAYTERFRLVRVGLSGLTPLAHYQFGMCIARVAEKLGRKAVYIASGDLSHKLTPDGPYGFAPEGPRFDKACMKYLEEGDFVKLLQMDPALSKAASECGLRSFWIMAGALDGLAVKSKKLSYQGTFGVGYGLVSFKVMREDPKRKLVERYEAARKRAIDAIRASEDAYVYLARKSIEQFIRTGERMPLPEDLPPEMEGRAGVFVSLKVNDELRGCIGTFEPTAKNIAAEIRKNALSAALHDPRFSPVTERELDDIIYSVDVLSEPELINDPAQLDAKTYGVIVESRGRRGLLLPDLAGVDTVDEQIKIARRKGGIPEDAPISIWRFTVERHH